MLIQRGPTLDTVDERVSDLKPYFNCSNVIFRFIQEDEVVMRGRAEESLSSCTLILLAHYQ